LDSSAEAPPNFHYGSFIANFAKISGALKKRAAQIELLLMDVDGTMAGGGVILL
jgi:hypothetical protein